MELITLVYKSLRQRLVKTSFLALSIFLALITIILITITTDFLAFSNNQALQQHGVIVNATLPEARSQFNYFGIIIETTPTEDAKLLFEQLTAAERLMLDEQIHLQVGSLLELQTKLVQLQDSHPKLFFQVDYGTFAARQQLFQQFANYAQFTILVISCVSLFLISTLMLASVNERLTEFAVLRTLGFRMRRVFALVLTETVFIYLGAAMISVIVGLYSSQLLLQGLFADDYQLYIPIGNILFIVILGSIVSCLAAIYPALRAAQRNPIDHL